MKTGDKVRFLSDTGGGTIAGFKGSNIVLVEDEDGFQIPVQKDEVVVIDTDDYNIANVHVALPKKKEKKADGHSSFVPKNDMGADDKTQAQSAMAQAEDETDPLDRPVTYKPKPQERKDGENLNVYLAFLPVNIKELSTTKFECYLINDCNYYVSYTYLSAEGGAWKLRAQGVVEPNTKIYIEDVEHAMLNHLEHVTIQLLAFKQDKPFALKPTIGVDLRIDATKFFKLHTFRQSLFFDEDVLLFPVVENDEPWRPLVLSASQLKEAMQKKGDKHTHKPQQARTGKERPGDEIIEVDLHADEILDTTAGMSAANIKEYQLKVFRETMERHLKEKGRRIVFIHGKGEGVLRNSLLQELKYRYKSCSFQDASFQQYGFGATMVIIH